MALPLEGRTIALAEARQLEELAQMLEKEGARTVRCPLLGILDSPDEAAVVGWLRGLIAGDFDWVVLFTGEGVRRLLGFAERNGMREPVVAALGRARLLTRGPKPVKALREVGLVPTLVAAAPTTEGVIASLRGQALRGLTVGVQRYSESNPELTDFLTQAGAAERPVQPYRYAPASDADRIAELVQQMANGSIDAIVFTSSPQVDRMFEVAEERHLTAQLRDGLSRTRVASVGPVLSQHLIRFGVPVNICPEQGFVMKNLVSQMKRVLSGP
jgi:uroporphyrinogen-III synthase